MIMTTKYDYGGVLGCLKCMFASCILKGTVCAKMKILFYSLTVTVMSSKLLFFFVLFLFSHGTRG